MTAIKVDRQPFDPGPAAWNEILPPAPGFGMLEENRTADWLVIGGGFAGLSAARRLRQLHPADRIVVLEARRMAEGPAGRNSGFMIDLPHHLASADYAGALEEDRIQTEMNRQAIRFAMAAADEHEMPATAIALSGKINAAATARGERHNLDYANHLAGLGERHEMLDAHQMQALSGSAYYRQGLFTPGTAMLQPALYIRELATGLARSGVALFEISPVVRLEKSSGIWSAGTPRGTVQAPKVILAVNGHAESFGFYRRRLMHIYLYASMTRPLTPQEEMHLGGEAQWGFTPADPMGTTVRKFASPQGPRIVVRNRFSWAPSRNVDAGKIASIERIHDQSFRARFPMLASTGLDYRWGGLLCLSWNNVTAFGEIEDGLFSACCQNGLGTAKGTSQGVLAAELASDVPSAHLDYLLSQQPPRRLPPGPMATLGANAYMRYAEFRAGREL